MSDTSEGLLRDEWFEDFDGPGGDMPDPAVWAPELGGGGWGDAQLQHYTATNAALTGDGCLALTARREDAELDSASGMITSARLITKSRLTLLYGTITARIRVPTGAGVWPAFWGLGANIDEVGWPACGEIDVMEFVGSDPHAVHSTLHGPGYAGVGGGIGRRYQLPEILGDDFHQYGVTWEPDRISWHLDGHEYHRLQPDDVPGSWPFRHPFYLLLNLAIGGNWPGNAAEPPDLPAVMLVDWIRITGSTVRTNWRERGFV